MSVELLLVFTDTNTARTVLEFSSGYLVSNQYQYQANIFIFVDDLVNKFHFFLFADFTSPDAVVSAVTTGSPNDDIISFKGVDVITPAQKLLARQLSCDVIQGKSLLVTGTVIGVLIVM